MAQKKRYSPLDSTSLASRITELRMKSGMSREMLAKILGVSVSNVGNYETGFTMAPTEKILILSELFGVSTDYLLGKTDAKTNDVNETAVCDYLGLDVETVRLLHDNPRDYKVKKTFSFLLKEQKLLQSLSDYIWSAMYEVFKASEYNMVPLKNKMELENSNRAHFADVLFDLMKAYDAFLAQENLNGNMSDEAVMNYIKQNVDIDAYEKMLADIDPEIAHESSVAARCQKLILQKIKPIIIDESNQNSSADK